MRCAEKCQMRRRRPIKCAGIAPLRKGQIFVEANPDIHNLESDSIGDLEALADCRNLRKMVDWRQVRETVERRDGLAREVNGSEGMLVERITSGDRGARESAEPTGTLSRRRLLKLGTLIAGTALIPGVALADLRVPYPPERTLKFYNLHTGESLSTTYCEKGCYVDGALKQINYILRDFRANEIKPIDPRLLDLLYTINRRLYTPEPFDIISGYRSPATNAMLAGRSEGVARHSMHIQGKAADIRVPGRPLGEVWRAAIGLWSGGVGFYPRSDFVHVDVGRVRFW